MLPSLEWIVGPTKSGKKTLASKMSERINAPHMLFKDWLRSKGLTNNNDDVKVHALISELVGLREPRMILVDFPQNSYQAKLFVKNAVAPSQIFSLECQMDTCQERMLATSQSDPSYRPSSVLSKEIAEYNKQIEDDKLFDNLS